MLDNRLQTFLTLCETHNYSVTAQKLNMTQPAVSQHIQYLEKHYQVNLISQKGKKFSLTEEGMALRQYVLNLKANSDRILPLLHRIKDNSRTLIFGATLTIGENTVPPILAKIYKQDPYINISMSVENTKVLQSMLWEGKIDFALLEGHFKQEQFESKLISDEPFIAICSPNNKISENPVNIEDLLAQRLILREPGSGTRDVLEQSLYIQNLSVRDFNHIIEIGNMNSIKYLCHENVGITFMYREAVKSELEQGYLKEISLINFNIFHPFSFVYLKNSPDEEYIKHWFKLFKSLRSN